MSAQRGRDMLIRVADGVGGWSTLAGLKTRRLALGNGTVDITDSDSAGRWRHLLSDAGVRQASISGQGIFRDAQSDALVREAFFNGAAMELQFAMPDFGGLEGAFQITSLEYSGNHDGEVTFEIAFESAAALTFEAT
ncbi:phage major tail protein, TP901-1 family [Notoacmeibacter marinus]|uniref:phage major tail protein, TP901-1 family n=1 Tax=Notoacmeibacter marinus TaxID=1876515 RepID=UPI000DF27D08|nr:phage major tail protein, TP901-1 family [Notoacmeibacter marinus]